ncbi:hypothetical protein [Candidatus Phytoplasma solani]|uniref:hypothetical protein n=1 Tax=Candidatus Phytoplasma solani TaxID=69896 RepID=UPI00358ED8E6
MAKKIIKTKKTKAKAITSKKVIPRKNKKLKKTVKKTTPKPTIIKKNPTIITKPTPKTHTKPITKTAPPQPTKIIVETQQKQDNWFVKILKSLGNTILFLLPILLIGGGICWVLFKFFPELASKFGGAFKNLKDACHNINDKTAEALEKIGISPQHSSTVSKILWLIGGCLLAAACCFIPFVGPLIGSLVLVATITYVSITSLTDKTPQTPPTNNSLPQQLENKNENPQINPNTLTQHHEEAIETNNNDEPQQMESQKKKKQPNQLN